MLFIARRYLFSKKSHSVINIIAGVSLVSVAVPVAAIIILLSVFNGFGTLVEGLNGGVDADLTVRPLRGRYVDSREVDTLAIRGVQGVESFALVNEQTLMLHHEGREAVVSLRGVDDNFTSVIPIEQHMRAGEFQPRLGDIDRIVVGNAMAIKLGVRNIRTSFVDIYSLRESRLSSFMPMISFVKDQVRVSGVYLLDMESESQYAYTSLRLLNRLSGRGEEESSEISSVVIRVADGESAGAVKSRVQGVVGDEFEVLSREELNPLLYDIIRYERWGIIFISSMVMLLASFSLVGIVAMLIIEKRDDTITLRSMGATHSQVRRIFFLQGMLISGIGAMAGAVAGVAITLVQQIWGVVKLPMGGFVITAYPVDLHVGDVAGVVAMALGIAALLNYIVTFEMIKK